MSSPLTTMRFQVDRDVYLNTMWRYGLRAVGVRLGIVVVLLAFLMFVNGLTTPYVAVAVACIVVFGLLSQYQATRKAIYHPMNSGGFGTRVLEFTAEDVRLTASNGIESKVPWKAFVIADRRGEFVFLYMNLQHAFIVPNVAFATPQDRDAFFALVETSVPWRGREKLRDVR